MRRLLAIFIALFVVLQYGAAAARPPSPCCAAGCGDPAMCVVAACKACAAHAVMPQHAGIATPSISISRPDNAARVSLPATVSDIWRPPR
ncbi:MAG: hypothetical protein EPO01_10750 [Aquabacterium sp.]|nr:MAG: hypothetical protein EPO01_10750 [Aquabacterium sp.]